MGHVSSKLFVAVDPVIKRRDHPTQSAGQSADFIRARCEVRNTDTAWGHIAFVAIAANFGRIGKIGNRIGDGRRQHKAKRDGHKRRHHKHLENAFAFQTDHRVDLACDGHKPYGAHDLAGMADRGECGELRFAVFRIVLNDAGLIDVAVFDQTTQAVFFVNGFIAGQNAEQFRHRPPKRHQEIGNYRGLIALFVLKDRLAGRHRSGGFTDQKILVVKHQNPRPLPQIKISQRHLNIDRVFVRQPDLGFPFKLGFEHVCDQFNLGLHRDSALDSQRVTRRIQVQDACHQNVQSDQVERDNLARQRRTVEREKAAARAAFPELTFDCGIRRDPIVTQNHIILPLFSG